MVVLREAMWRSLKKSFLQSKDIKEEFHCRSSVKEPESQLGVVACTRSPSTWEAEAGDLLKPRV